MISDRKDISLDLCTCSQLLQMLEHLPKVGFMLFPCFASDKDVINKVNNSLHL